MNFDSFPDAVSKVVMNILKNEVHTIKPAKILTVNYKNATALIKPLTKTKFADGRQQEEPEAMEVPLFILNGNAGKAKITMPVKPNDLCFLLYSDRDFGGFLRSDGKSVADSHDRTPFGRNPIGALVGLFTQATPVEIDPENIIIKNESTTLKITPKGETILEGNLTVNGTIKATQTISSDVDVTAGLTNISLLTHTHGGVTSGSSSTLPPNPT